MNLWCHLLRCAGWTVDISAGITDKCVICVAPHTSNWDFPLGYAAYRSIGRKAGFLMKKAWFFFPLGLLLKAMGGIPVAPVKGQGLSVDVAGRMRKAKYMNLAVTPEGTRSLNAEWRKGFIYIALEAEVPIYLAVIDYLHKQIRIEKRLDPEGSVDEILAKVKTFYADKAPSARYPEKFSV